MAEFQRIQLPIGDMGQQAGYAPLSLPPKWVQYVVDGEWARAGGIRNRPAASSVGYTVEGTSSWTADSRHGGFSSSAGAYSMHDLGGSPGFVKAGTLWGAPGGSATKLNPIGPLFPLGVSDAWDVGGVSYSQATGVGPARLGTVAASGSIVAVTSGATADIHLFSTTGAPLASLVSPSAPASNHLAVALSGGTTVFGTLYQSGANINYRSALVSGGAWGAADGNLGLADVATNGLKAAVASGTTAYLIYATTTAGQVKVLRLTWSGTSPTVAATLTIGTGLSGAIQSADIYYVSSTSAVIGVASDAAATNHYYADVNMSGAGAVTNSFIPGTAHPFLDVSRVSVAWAYNGSSYALVACIGGSTDSTYRGYSLLYHADDLAGTNFTVQDPLPGMCVVSPIVSLSAPIHGSSLFALFRGDLYGLSPYLALVPIGAYTRATGSRDFKPPAAILAYGEADLYVGRPDGYGRTVPLTSDGWTMLPLDPGTSSLAGPGRVYRLTTSPATPPLPGGRLAAGGSMFIADGGRLMPLSLPAPDGVSAQAPAGAGGTWTTAGQYSWALQWTWQRSDGSVVRSPPTFVTQTIVTLTNTVEIRVLNSPFDPAGARGGTLKLRIYRTTGAGLSDWRLLTVVENASATYTSYISYSDSGAAPAGEYLPQTPSGTLDDSCWPPIAHAAAGGERIAAVSRERPYQVQFSKLGHGQFNEGLAADVPDRAVAVAPLGGGWLALCENSLHYISGSGPDNLGAGAWQVSQLSAAHGCASARSVAHGPFGVIFEGRRGWFRVSPGLEVALIPELTGVTFSHLPAGPLVAPQQTQVRIYGLLAESILEYVYAPSLGSLVAAVWDWTFDRWAFHSASSDVTSALQLGTATWLGRASALEIEDPASNTPFSTTVPCVIGTGWIRLDGAGGNGRLRRVGLLGSLVSYYRDDPLNPVATGTLRLRGWVDDNDVALQSDDSGDGAEVEDLTTSSLPTSSRAWLIRRRWPRRRCRSVRLEIYLAPAHAQTCIELNGLELEVGVVEGRPMTTKSEGGY